MTSFSVVIPTLRRPEPLRRAVESLLACIPLPEEIIVVDGDPEGSAREIVEALVPGSNPSLLRYLPSEIGLTKQRNRGIDASTGDVIVFFDDDVVVDAAIFGLCMRLQGRGARGRYRQRAGSRAAPFRWNEIALATVAHEGK